MTDEEPKLQQRPTILGILPAFVPSTLIDVVQPLVNLDRAGMVHFRVTLESLFVQKDLDQVDLVVLCRNVEPKGILEAIQARAIPSIYDLDDNLFEVPLNTELGQYHRSPERQAIMTAYIQQASLVRVYSDPVYRRCLELNPRVEKVVAPVNWSQIQPPERRDPGAPVRIVYATSRVEDELNHIFSPALDRLAQTHAGRFEMVFWGSIPEDYRRKPGFQHLPAVPDYNRFLRTFSRKGFDIGLAPLLDDVFHLSKTNNKYREYGASRVAGIYSDVQVYSECVEHGRTGLLAANQPEAWYHALCRLIEDDALRRTIQEEAYHFTRQHYQQVLFDTRWQQQISQVLAAKRDTSAFPQPVSQAKEVSMHQPVAAAAPRGANRWHKIVDKLARVRSEGAHGLGPFLRWGSFTAWTLLKVNWLKRL